MKSTGSGTAIGRFIGTGELRATYMLNIRADDTYPNFLDKVNSFCVQTVQTDGTSFGFLSSIFFANENNELIGYIGKLPTDEDISGNASGKFTITRHD